MSTRILLVDDHKIFLAGLAELINKTANMHVVGTATDARQALELMSECRPDVVFTDITMPGIDGIVLTKQLATEFPTVKIICLSMHADAQLIESMFKAGASAYVLKDCEMAVLIEAIHKVTAGETYMSCSVAEVVADSFRQQGSNAGQVSEAELTEREQQVLVLLADGLTTKQIASELDLSIKTIGTYREHLMQKLDIHSIAGLTKYAIRKGLTSND